MSFKKKGKHPPCENHIVDICIVGAGLAGLHTALELSERYPKANICIAEAYHYIGGRVLTYKPKVTSANPKGFPGIQWEMGAGRIHQSHHRILSYCFRYGLTIVPLSKEQLFLSTKTKSLIDDPWPTNASAITTLLHKLKPELLENNTVDTLLHKVTGESSHILKTFPYSAETHVLRADQALKSFQHEMGSSKDYLVVKEGLSSIIQGMVKELKSRGVQILLNHKLIDVDSEHRIAKFENDCSIKFQDCILALHSVALKQIPFTRKLPALQHVVMCPLLRIYAIFPTTQTKQSWFSDLPKIVTDSSVRFFIPINPAKGVVMISYTDASDTEGWTSLLEKKGLEGLQTKLMSEIRSLFPERLIPDPLYLKPHPWTEGCSYWTPGSYSVKEMSNSVLNPFPNIFICNESFSEHHQCWMEGALDHAEQMLDIFLSSQKK